jgi:hypothetical protein
MIFGYYSKFDETEEIISKTIGFSRLQAAKHFAYRKQLDLKVFIKLYSVKVLV